MTLKTWHVFNIDTRKVVYRTPSYQKAVEKAVELGQGYELACHWYRV